MRTQLTDPFRYQQYLLHCDSRGERFSVGDFVWGPGQSTPSMTTESWGLVGVLRGAGSTANFDLKAGAAAWYWRWCSTLLKPGDVAAVSSRAGDAHRVANAYEDRSSISIHLYGGNIRAVERSTYDLAGRPEEIRLGLCEPGHTQHLGWIVQGMTEPETVSAAAVRATLRRAQRRSRLLDLETRRRMPIDIRCSRRSSPSIGLPSKRRPRIPRRDAPRVFIYDGGEKLVGEGRASSPGARVLEGACPRGWPAGVARGGLRSPFGRPLVQQGVRRARGGAASTFAAGGGGPRAHREQSGRRRPRRPATGRAPAR